MKKLFIFFAFILVANFSFAYHFGGISVSTQGSDTVIVGTSFDIYWGYTIYQDSYGDNYPAMNVEMKLYLSKDDVYDATDVLLSSDVSSATSNSGTLGETTYGITMLNSTIPSGICYLIAALDPDDKIKDSRQADNFATSKIYLISTAPDLEVTQSKYISVINPSPLYKMFVTTEFLNAGNQTIDYATYKIELANTEAGLATPAYTFEKKISTIKTSPRINSTLDTIDFTGRGITITDFYIRTSLVDASSTEKFTNNNSFTKHILDKDLEKMDVNYDYVYMKNGVKTLTSCKSLIFDDGGEKGDFSPNITSTLMIYPSEAGTPVELVLDSIFGLYYGDYITIYGDATAKSKLLSFDNWTTKKRYKFTSTSPDGSMAIKFETNYFAEHIGFKISQTCKSPELRKVTKNVCTNPYTYNGYTFTKNIDTTLLYGKDSIVNLSLTIGKPSPVNNITLSSDYSIVFNGVRYFTSKDITMKYVNKANCDSTVVYHLNITKPCQASTYYVDTVVCNKFIIDGTTYTESTTKTVKYSNIYGCDSTVVYQVTIKRPPTVDIGNVFYLGYGHDTIIGMAPLPNTTYLWSDKSTNSKLLVTKSGTYYLTATNNCGSNYDNVKIVIKECLNKTLTIDTTVCNSITINGTLVNTSSSKIVTYKTALGCDSTVTYNIAIQTTPVVNLGENKTLAFGRDTLIGLISAAKTNYKWNTGKTSPTIAVTETGTYSLTVTNKCGSVSDEISITILDENKNTALIPTSTDDTQITIHPTVTASFVKIHCPGYDVSILNGLTQTVDMTKTIDGDYILNASGLTPGVYHLYFYSNNKQAVLKTIIVE